MSLGLLLICGSNLLWNGTADQFLSPDGLGTDQFSLDWNQLRSLNLNSSEQNQRFSDQSMKIKACHENHLSLSSVLDIVLYCLYLQLTQSLRLQKGVTIKLTVIEISFLQNKSMHSSTFWTQSFFFPLMAQCDGSSETKPNRYKRSPLHLNSKDIICRGITE